jgi:GNAT superfamily N-acetyltransferase
VDAAVAAVVERFRACGLPGTWHVGPTTRPTDLGERLLARGFTGGWSDAGMAADLRALREDQPVPAGLRIARVRDARELDAWVRTRALDPEGELESRWVAGTYLAIGLGDDVPWRHYVGWLDGRPVATATLFLGAGVAGVYFVLTVPEARRRGIGAAITLAALREARDLGYRLGVLGASAMGLPLYRRLGFEEYCRLAVYEWHPDRPAQPAEPQ